MKDGEYIRPAFPKDLIDNGYEYPHETFPAHVGAETIPTQMIFLWTCPRCQRSGHESYDSFTAYEGLVECPECETPWRLKEPWK